MSVTEFFSWIENFKSRTNYTQLLNQHELAQLFAAIDSITQPTPVTKVVTKAPASAK